MTNKKKKNKKNKNNSSLNKSQQSSTSLNKSQQNSTSLNNSQQVSKSPNKSQQISTSLNKHSKTQSEEAGGDTKIKTSNNSVRKGEDLAATNYSEANCNVQKQCQACADSGWLCHYHYDKLNNSTSTSSSSHTYESSHNDSSNSSMRNKTLHTSLFNNPGSAQTTHNKSDKYAETRLAIAEGSPLNNRSIFKKYKQNPAAAQCFHLQVGNGSNSNGQNYLNSTFQEESSSNANNINAENTSCKSFNHSVNSSSTHSQDFKGIPSRGGENMWHSNQYTHIYPDPETGILIIQTSNKQFKYQCDVPHILKIVAEANYGGVGGIAEPST